MAAAAQWVLRSSYLSGSCPAWLSTMNGAPLPLLVSPWLSLSLVDISGIITTVCGLHSGGTAPVWLWTLAYAVVSIMSIRLGTRGVHSKFDRLWCPINQLSGCPKCPVCPQQKGRKYALSPGWLAGPSWSPRPEHCTPSLVRPLLTALPLSRRGPGKRRCEAGIIMTPSSFDQYTN